MCVCVLNYIHWEIMLNCFVSFLLFRHFIDYLFVCSFITVKSSNTDCPATILALQSLPRVLRQGTWWLGGSRFYLDNIKVGNPSGQTTLTSSELIINKNMVFRYCLHFRFLIKINEICSCNIEPQKDQAVHLLCIYSAMIWLEEDFRYFLNCMYSLCSDSCTSPWISEHTHKC
jgi:hypothetical protein